MALMRGAPGKLRSMTQSHQPVNSTGSPSAPCPAGPARPRPCSGRRRPGRPGGHAPGWRGWRRRRSAVLAAAGTGMNHVRCPPSRRPAGWTGYPARGSVTRRSSRPPGRQRWRSASPGCGARRRRRPASRPAAAPAAPGRAPPARCRPLPRWAPGRAAARARGPGRRAGSQGPPHNRRRDQRHQNGEPDRQSRAHDPQGRPHFLYYRESPSAAAYQASHHKRSQTVAEFAWAAGTNTSGTVMPSTMP